jgi:hypothetical protein
MIFNITFFVLYWANNHAVETPVTHYGCRVFYSSLPPYKLEKRRWLVIEVLTAVYKDNTVSWVVIPCSSDRVRRFRGTRRLLTSGSKSKPSKKQAEAKRQDHIY